MFALSRYFCLSVFLPLSAVDVALTRAVLANPENTILSFNTAAKLGADFVEFDVQVLPPFLPFAIRRKTRSEFTRN
jgi:hypothetical protein